MTDRTHKNKISDLESDLEQKKSENAKNSAKSRKLKNELKRQTDSIASAKSQVFILNYKTMCLNKECCKTTA